MSDQLIPVPFRTDTLYIVNHIDQPFVPMKPVVEAVGLDWKTQFRKLVGEQRYGHMTIPLHSPGGLQDTLCIPLRKLNGWLFSINPSKVKPELRDTVIAYQEECFQALYDYWHTGAATRPGQEPAAVDDFSDPADDFTPPTKPRFSRLDPAIMRELRLLNPNLVQAYLVDLGITPEFVNGLLQDRLRLTAPDLEPDVAPIDVLAARITNLGAVEDHEAWYLERKEFLALCTGFDPRRTATWLHDLGLLRANRGRLTYRASTLHFGGRRPLVFCILKALLDAGLDALCQRNNNQKGSQAHVQ